MDYVSLGNTGLRASVAGLGCGGFSRLGLRLGKTETEVIELVRLALDLGINLIDTAADYGTEAVVGKAIKSFPRDKLVITTKVAVCRTPEWASPETVVESLDNSLRQLDTDHVDLFQLHGLLPEAYDHAIDRLVPALMKEKEKGKFRHLGVTELQANDVQHQMLQRAVKDDRWGVVMVAYHMMHQTARTTLLPQILAAKRPGMLVMTAVRNIFSQPRLLKTAIQELVAAGLVPQHLATRDNPLDFLIRNGGAANITEAAYRFARHEPGVDVVLFGTGNPDHLRANVASLLKPPLPDADRQQIISLFGRLVGVGLDLWKTPTPA